MWLGLESWHSRTQKYGSTDSEELDVQTSCGMSTDTTEPRMELWLPCSVTFVQGPVINSPA